MIVLKEFNARPGRAGGLSRESPAIEKMKKERTMKGRSFTKAIEKLHRGEKGITGLETAIILIAFVTVAAVLAYSVLSAGIFSSERGQEAVYSGLAASQASMQVAGNVYATGVDASNGTDGTLTKAGNVSFQLKSVLATQSVDLTKCTVNFHKSGDAGMTDMGLTDTVTGMNVILEPNAVRTITVNVSTYNLGAYDAFQIEIIPPTGASVNVPRSMPPAIEPFMNLH